MYKNGIVTFCLSIFLFITINCSIMHAEEQQEQKSVLLAILARNKAHLLPRFLRCIEALEYDKKCITIYINTNNNEDKTEEILENWTAQNREQYRSIIFESHEVEGIPKTGPHEWNPERFKLLGSIRNKSLQKTKECKCDYYFVVDCDNFIAPKTLSYLIGKDKPIIAPLLRSVPTINDPYSNYFCDITEGGYYQSHPDYQPILQRAKIGTFKVPVVHCTYLVKAEYVDALNYIDGTDDYEFVIFSRNARNRGIEQYICNELEFGTLLHFSEELSLEQEKIRTADLAKLNG